MGQFTPDGGWTSNKGRHYGPNEPISDDADAQESSADTARYLGPTPLSDPNSPQGNTFTGSRLNNSAPGAQLDTGQADFQRQQTSDFLATLQQQASTGSGAWEKTLQEATTRGRDAATALGSSSPGTDYGSSERGIATAQGGVDQRAAGQANILREQSKLSAQDQLDQLISGQGAQDIGQATAAANAGSGLRQTNLLLKQQATKNAGQYASGVGQGVSAGAGLSKGGEVPGKPKVFGDDEANDIVSAKLSPGEVVLPRSIAHDPEAAAEFVRTLNASHARSGGAGMADGGDVSPYEAELNRPWKPGDVDPTGPRPGSFDMFGLEGDVQAPSVKNGGILDTGNFAQTRVAGNQLAEMQRARANGGGPSVAPQMLTNASDAAIAKGMQGGAPAEARIASGAEAAQAGGAEAAVQKAKEQESGQNALGKRLSTARGQELSLAQAQQEAAWRNTMTNLGIGVEQQAAMRGLFSGAGQAATAFAGAGGKGGGGSSDMSTWDSGELSDYSGDRGGPADLGGSDPDFKAHGGTIGYADGGKITARGPGGEKLETEREFISRRAAEQERGESRRRAYEEETGDEYQPHAKTAKREPSTQERLAEFARSLTASVPRFAGGGEVDASGVPAGYVPPLYTPGPGVDAGAAALVPASYQPQAAPPAMGFMEGSGLARAMAKPPGYDPVLGVGFSAPAVVARQEAADAAKPLPNGIKAPDAAPAKDEAPPPAPAARPIGGGVSLPPSHGLEEGFAANEAQLANEANTEAEVGKARAEVAGIAARESAIQAAQLDMKAAHDRARQQTSEAMTRWTAAQEEFNRIDANVDPGRFWASRNTGQKVLGIIGLALGAAGTGPDGINKSAVMMNQAIDRDIEAQKAQHELRLKKGTQKLQAAQTYYDMARQAGHDDIAATELAKAAALDAAALRAEKIVAATNEPIAKAKGQAFAAALRGGAIDKTKMAEQQTFENRVKNQQLNIAATAASAKGGLSEGERKSVGDVTSAAKDALGLIDSIEGTLKATQSAIPGKTAFNQHVGSDAARLDTDTAQLVVKMKDINKLGQIGPGDKALLEEAIGDPKAVFSLEGTKRAKLDRVKQIIIDSVKNERSARGLR
jgi:hypothetical protein